MSARDTSFNRMKSLEPRSLRDQLLHPYACYTALRESTHVAYNTAARFWEVTDYAAVRSLASANDIFSSDETRFQTSVEGPLLKSMLNTDPPRHRQLRSLVSQAFTPRAIAQLAPRIQSIAHELLDRVVAQGTMDVIQDLSYPLPVIVIAEMLGVPISDRDQFKRWSDNLVAGEYDEFAGEDAETVMKKVRARVQVTIDEISDYFRSVIAQRRKQPANDLISALLAAQIDGESLSEQDLLGFCALLLIAGNITTTNLIGNAILCFDEHPEAMAQLRAQPELMPDAIEEVLRYRSPAIMIGRFPLVDVTLAGQQIPKGQFVLGWLACANFDPTQFPQPERFDITRSPNQHLAFGHGIHFCLGAPLARLETKIVLTAMLARLQNIQRDTTQALEPVHSSFIYGAKHVPITFQPVR